MEEENLLSEKLRLVLASASPRREELLRQIGFEPEIIPSQVEEIVTSTEPAQVVMELSAQK
ncbi:MAG: Maf family protein, partial [Clostridium sp.]|nr:Maf family protein [Clostridium sp.]